MYLVQTLTAVSPPAEFANDLYSLHIRLCCVSGRALSARSNVLRVFVTSGCRSRNERYSSQITGILFKRTTARSKRALTLLKSALCLTGFLFLRCFIRKSRYIFHSL